MNLITRVLTSSIRVYVCTSKKHEIKISRYIEVYKANTHQLSVYKIEINFDRITEHFLVSHSELAY